MAFRFPVEFLHIGAREHVAFPAQRDILLTAALDRHADIAGLPFGLPASRTFLFLQVGTRGAVDPAVRDIAFIHDDSPLFNTVFFMGLLCFFFYNTEYVQELVASKGATNPLSFVIALVGVQASVEALIGCLLAGTLGLVLSKTLHRA